MDILTREDAARLGKPKFYTGKPCKKGHIAERYTCNAGCVYCINPPRYRQSHPYFVPWVPAVPFQVPKWFAPEHYTALDARMRQGLQDVVTEWLTNWGRTDEVAMLYNDKP